MKRSTKSAPLALLLLLALAVPTELRSKDPEFALPKVYHAKTYPAHDAHDDEKFTIAADPYDMPDKQAKLYKTDFRRAGFLPVHIIFSNDSGQTVSLAKMNIVLVTNHRDKIQPATEDDIYRRIAKQTRRGDEPQVQLPIPLPRKKPRSISKQAEAEVEGSQFMARAVEPHASQAGMFFFDVQNIENPLAGGRIEVTGIRNADGQELFYFEIPMEKYLGYDPTKQ